MSSLLRKIFKSYDAQRGIFQYLKYAIGEIILVVIGILIALEVNKYNEERKGAEMERTYLNKIAVNISSSNRELERVIEESGTLIAAIDSIYALNEKDIGKVSDSLLLNWILSAADYSIYTADDSAARELLATGRLILIRDTFLRNLVSSWDSRLHEIEKFEQECIYWYREYNSFLEGSVDWYGLTHNNANDNPFINGGKERLLRSQQFSKRTMNLYFNTGSLNTLYKKEKQLMDAAAIRIKEQLELYE